MFSFSVLMLSTSLLHFWRVVELPNWVISYWLWSALQLNSKYEIFKIWRTQGSAKLSTHQHYISNSHNTQEEREHAWILNTCTLAHRHSHLHTFTHNTHLIHFISDLSGMCSPPLPHFQMVWVLQMSKLASKNSILWWEAQLASKSFPKTVFSAFSCKIDAVTEKSAGFQIIIFCWEEVGF